MKVEPSDVTVTTTVDLGIDVTDGVVMKTENSVFEEVDEGAEGVEEGIVGVEEGVDVVDVEFDIDIGGIIMFDPVVVPASLLGMLVLVLVSLDVVEVSAFITGNVVLAAAAGADSMSEGTAEISVRPSSACRLSNPNVALEKENKAARARDKYSQNLDEYIFVTSVAHRISSATVCNAGY